MSRLLINEPPLEVLPTLATEIGLNEAIVLQQIHYWLGNPKVGKDHDGRRWVYNSVRQWREENFPFWSEDTIKRTLANLRKQGLVMTAILNEQPRDRTLWYSIDYERLAEIEDAISAKCTNAEVQVAPMDGGNLPQALPETTSEGIERDAREAEPAVPHGDGKVASNEGRAWQLVLRRCRGDQERAGAIFQMEVQCQDKFGWTRPGIYGDRARQRGLEGWWSPLFSMLDAYEWNQEATLQAMNKEVELQRNKGWGPSKPLAVSGKVIAAASAPATNGNGKSELEQLWSMVKLWCIGRADLATFATPEVKRAIGRIGESNLKHANDWQMDHTYWPQFQALVQERAS